MPSVATLALKDELREKAEVRGLGPDKQRSPSRPRIKPRWPAPLLCAQPLKTYQFIKRARVNNAKKTYLAIRYRRREPRTFDANTPSLDELIECSRAILEVVLASHTTNPDYYRRAPRGGEGRA